MYIENERKTSLLLHSMCSATKKSYYIRIDKYSNQNNWLIKYAFPYLEDNYNKSSMNQDISGAIYVADDYNGCPYCETKTICFCKCKQIFDTTRNDGYYTCPWCNVTDNYSTKEYFSTTGLGL